MITLTIGHFTVVYSSYLAMNASEAGGDLALIQTVGNTNNLIYTTKAMRSLSKQGRLQPRCYSKARLQSR